MKAGFCKLVLAMIILFTAGHGASEPGGGTASSAVGSAPSAAGAFLGPEGTLGPQRSLGRAQEPIGEGERWLFYRDFWFDYDSSKLDAIDASKVSEVASYMRQNPTLRIGIDDAMDEGNAELSHRRVDSVRESLIKAGVPAYKIYRGAFGDPLARRERRVEVLFSTRH